MISRWAPAQTAAVMLLPSGLAIGLAGEPSERGTRAEQHRRPVAAVPTTAPTTAPMVTAAEEERHRLPPHPIVEPRRRPGRGRPCDQRSAGRRHPARRLCARRRHGRAARAGATEVRGPIALGGGGTITDAVHKDHVHMAVIPGDPPAAAADR